MILLDNHKPLFCRQIIEHHGIQYLVYAQARYFFSCHQLPGAIRLLLQARKIYGNKIILAKSGKDDGSGWYILEKLISSKKND